MSDSRSTAVMESQEVLEHTNLSAELLARELERKSVKELREICVSKGIDTSTCVDKRDLVDIMVLYIKTLQQRLIQPLLQCFYVQRLDWTCLQMLPFTHSRRRRV